MGNEALLASEGIDVSVPWKEIARKGADRGETVVFVSRGEEVWGIIRLGDALRLDLPQAVANLQERGRKVQAASHR